MCIRDREEYYRAYRLQAEQMAEYAIDAFIIETVIDINEALIILQACQDTAPQIPVLLSLTFSSLKRGGCTLMGNTAADIAAKAEANGAAAVGANCGDVYKRHAYKLPHYPASNKRPMVWSFLCVPFHI